MATSSKSTTRASINGNVLPESAIRDAITDLTNETNRVASTISARDNADKSMQALLRALINADAAIVDNASKLTNPDATLKSVRSMLDKVRKATETADISFVKGDELSTVVNMYATLASLHRLGKFTAADFQPALDAWNNLPRHKGRNEDAYPFTVELVRDGKVVRTLGARAHKVYPSNLKTALEKVIDRNLPRSDEQWKHARASLGKVGEATVYDVTVRKAS